MNNERKINLNIQDAKLAIIGLGYVGLPLAIEFGKKREVIGFDINKNRVHELLKKIDSNKEVLVEDFKQSLHLKFTSKINDIKDCKIFIITIPTPVDIFNNPDLSLLNKCCIMLGSLIKKDDLIIFESTVYPGVTEEYCAPLLEKQSSLKFNQDFFCGYSPERINPGDQKNRISKIIKVTSGSTPEAAIKVDDLYKQIILAGTHKSPSIKVAEAAKVIENIQRDINIALMNELAMIFHKLNIDTNEVLDAAKTKWNFLPFYPGLVGGHCIGVDPYYLAHKAKQINFDPLMILSGRNVNNAISKHVFDRLIKSMIKKNINVHNSEILIMGLAFKENCSDIRNSKVFDIISLLSELNCKITVFDPRINFSDSQKNYYNNFDKLPMKKFHAVLIAVAHDEFKDIGIKSIKRLVLNNHVIFDLKSIFKKDEADERL